MHKGDYIRKMALSKWRMKLFMIKLLPMAFLAGLKVMKIDHDCAEVSIPYKYLNKNPFKSIYFAAQSMAAELSTGILAMAAVKDQEKPISMLVLNMNSSYHKKALGKIVFTCRDGMEIANTVEAAAKNNEGQTITVKSVGRNENGEKVSEFEFTWTFKLKQQKTQIKTG